jgi:alkanesulfonate monooxygenase SsuD/methylene tetrahydromethanopterin reductase-like flavin-dependent oxidoreductase (luciferase family)
MSFDDFQIGHGSRTDDVKRGSEFDFCGERRKRCQSNEKFRMFSLFERLQGQKEKFSGSHETEAYRLHRKRFAGGAGTYPLVGTPEHIVSEMVRMHEVGFAGTTASFVNFKNELPYFIVEVLPLLGEVGLRGAP